MLSHWLSQVFSHPDLAGVLVIAAKTMVIYLFIIIGLRLIGTRELGEMTIYDFVLVVVISNAVQNALVGGDTTLAGGLVAALTLLIIDRLLTALLGRSSWLEHQLLGEPVVLVDSGHARADRLRKEGIQHGELMAALREHGVLSLNDVQLAVLEVDGTISVVPKEATVHRTRRRFRGVRAT